MQGFVRTLILFALFTMGGYSLLVFAWVAITPAFLRKNLEYQIPGFMRQRMVDVKKVDSLDILFVGSSHAYRGFDTRIFKEHGLHTFNMGSSSQTPIQFKYLAERYVSRLHPRLVIIEVYPEVFGLDGLESALDLIASDQIGWGTFEMAARINHIKSYNALIYQSVSGLFCFEDSRFWSAPNAVDTYIAGSGFVESKLVNFCCPQPVEKNWLFRTDQMKAFEATLKILNEHKISFVLVWAPISNRLYHGYKNNSHASQILSRHGRFFNFNEQMSLTDSLHFYDLDHLNQKGVRLFNEELIRVLKENHLLPTE